MGHVRAAGGVHPDRAALAQRHTGLLKRERLGHRALAGGDEDVVAFEVGVLARGVAVAERHLAGLTRDLGDLGGSNDREVLLFLEQLAERLGDLGLRLGQHPLLRLDHDNMGAEVGEDLRHLQADRAGADDAELLGRSLETPDRVRGEHALRIRPRNRRDEGRRAGGDDAGAEADTLGRSRLPASRDISTSLCVSFLVIRRPHVRVLGIAGGINKNAVGRVEAREALAHLDPHALVGLQRHVAARL